MEREHYMGLSIEDCIKLYNQKLRVFREEWESALLDILSRAIRARVRDLAGKPEGEDQHYCVILPFEVKLPDEDGCDQWWIFLETYECGSRLKAGRIDDNENYVTTSVDHTVDTYVYLYNRLKRMGFWDQEWAHSFRLE